VGYLGEICIERLLRALVLGLFVRTVQAKERSSHGIIRRIGRSVQVELV
jgi:hypothetical protein